MNNKINIFQEISEEIMPQKTEEFKEVSENRNTKDVAEQHRIGITKANCGIVENFPKCTALSKEGFSHE